MNTISEIEDAYSSGHPVESCFRQLLTLSKKIQAQLEACELRQPVDDQKLVAIYDAYPRKAARPAALQAIKRAIKKVGHDQLKAHVEAYAAYHQANQIDLQFTPMCATWMNQERWADTPVTVTPKAPPVEFGRIQYLRQQISESPAFPGGRYFADHTRPETRETLKRNLEELLRLNPNEDISHLRV